MPKSLLSTLLAFSLIFPIALSLGCHSTQGDSLVLLEICNAEPGTHSENEKRLFDKLAKELDPKTFQELLIAIDTEKLSYLDYFDRAMTRQHDIALNAIDTKSREKLKTTFDSALSDLMEGPLSGQSSLKKEIQALQLWSPGKTAKECLSR